ncbi:AsnC family transcriptional regulator [Sesbania bispinosa]|nr:AsnC family transcriptional regulator [Sesbania bispinosa]
MANRDLADRNFLDSLDVSSPSNGTSKMLEDFGQKHRIYRRRLKEETNIPLSFLQAFNINYLSQQYFYVLKLELNRFSTSLFGEGFAFLGDFLVFDEVACSLPNAFRGEVISSSLFNRSSLALDDEEGMVDGFLIDGLVEIAGFN